MDEMSELRQQMEEDSDWRKKSLQMPQVETGAGASRGCSRRRGTSTTWRNHSAAPSRGSSSNARRTTDITVVRMCPGLSPAGIADNRRPLAPAFGGVR
eukprot:SAG22_NODE_2832_length_2170_cov_1.074360_2_plen_98_part_00